MSNPMAVHRLAIGVHGLALRGFIKVALDTLARLITRRTEPNLKLH